MVNKVNASHILVKTQDEANSIVVDLMQGRNFEEIAAIKSICPSRKNGGNLGWFGRGRMVKEFEAIAFSTPKGQISKPFKTQFGWHVIKVIDVA